MPAERVPMRQVREILRLTFSGDVAGREIARRLGIAPSTVRAVVERFRSSGLSWPLGDDITDEELEERLYGTASGKQGHCRHAEPDFSRIHRELKRKHVTLSILWEEYIEQNPDAYRYSRFCELYRNWEARLSVTMRQSHAGGDKLFVDYAGDGVPVTACCISPSARAKTVLLACMASAIRPRVRSCRSITPAIASTARATTPQPIVSGPMATALPAWQALFEPSSRHRSL